ncbi:MAG TPA: DUF4340 domain-containing protein [Chthoniobacterales bacterium]|nr:DUF4340 domain-containing protein [Chthoniobacterales bacterium]
MNWKTTTVLFAVVLGLGLYIKFYESKQLGTYDAEKHARNVVNFDRDKIDGIVIQNGDDKIELRRHDQNWRLETPVKDQADSLVVDNLLSGLENWQKQSTIPAKEIDADKGRLAEFGLNKPKLRLKLTGPGAPPEIWFGKDAALEGRMYVRFDNSKDVFVANSPIKKDIEKKADEFRDKKLTDLLATQVNKLVLKTSAGEMELEKKGDHWEIVKPMRARADDQKVGDLIAQITNARIEQFVAEDKGDLNPYGLAQPKGSITLFAGGDKSGKAETPAGQGQMLQIGSVPEKNPEQIYVRFSARGFVYTLPKKIESILQTQPNDLRDRHLIRFDRNILDRLTIEAQGKPKVVLARKNEAWTIASRNDAPANAGDANRLVESLSNEQVTKFVEDVASNLAKYGLDKPQLQLTLSSFATENTAETKAGERPFGTIAFGRTEGDDVYARVGDEPFVVAVKKSTVENIKTDPVQWQSLAIFNFKPEQIHRISVTTDRELILTRGPNNEWTAAKETTPLNQANVQTLVNSLATLHAVRWLGTNAPPKAFDKPPIVISFTTSPDDKAVHKLTIGAADAQGVWPAKVDEREGVFALNAADVNVLRQSLIQPPVTPSPTPAATASPSPSPIASPR